MKQINPQVKRIYERNNAVSRWSPHNCGLENSGARTDSVDNGRRCFLRQLRGPCLSPSAKLFHSQRRCHPLPKPQLCASSSSEHLAGAGLSRWSCRALGLRERRCCCEATAGRRDQPRHPGAAFILNVDHIPPYRHPRRHQHTSPLWKAF